MRVLSFLLATSVLLASATTMAAPSANTRAGENKPVVTKASAESGNRSVHDAQTCKPEARLEGADVVAQTRKPPCCGECRTNDNGARGCYIWVDRQLVCSSCVD
jgi:hypothetical protein